MTSPVKSVINDEYYCWGLSSSLDIRARSFGSITTDLLLDYEGGRFHHNGLFSQKIFGPVTSWQCECGLYTPESRFSCDQSSFKPLSDAVITIQEAGVRFVCEQCKILLTTNSCRRERFGHIELATPILHPWMWGNDHRPVELLLGVSTRELRLIMQGRRYVYLEKSTWHRELALAEVISDADAALPTDHLPRWQAGYAVLRHLLENIDLEQIAHRLTWSLTNIRTTRAEPALWRGLSRRLMLVRDLIHNNTRPINFLLEVLPVLPAGQRRIRANRHGAVRVDELTRRYQDLIKLNESIERYTEDESILGPFRNRLSRRVSRVFDLLPGSFPYPPTDRWELPPEAKEASNFPVHRIRTIRPAKLKRPRPWKSKRVDYSAVSVLVPDASLSFDECGLPLDPIAWELFRPFISQRIMNEKGFTRPIADAFVTCQGEFALRHLRSAMQEWPVVMSFPGAYPTGRVKAFRSRPVLDRAIHVHPAIFQQLGLKPIGSLAKVFLPLSEAAAREAKAMARLGDKEESWVGIAHRYWPTDEALLGCHLATSMEAGILDSDYHPANCEKWRSFNSRDEIEIAVELGKLKWSTPIVFALPKWRTVWNDGASATVEASQINRILTTPGRVVIDAILREQVQTTSGYAFFNQPLNRKSYRGLREWLLENISRSELQAIVEQLTRWGQCRLTQAGLSLATDDFRVPDSKPSQIAEAFKSVSKTQRLYDRGVISSSERQNKVHDIWHDARETISRDVMLEIEKSPNQNALHTQVAARQNINIPQLRRLLGATGLLGRPDGQIFQVPVLSNLSEGVSAVEYFMLLLGQRRAVVADKHHNAEKQRIVRQLAPLLRDLQITSVDCGTSNGIDIRQISNPWYGGTLRDLRSALPGRTATETLNDPVTDVPFQTTGETISARQAERLGQSGITVVQVRSPLTCDATGGVCAACCGQHPHQKGRNLPGATIGSQALLALADELWQVNPASYYYISRPGGNGEGEVRASHQGKVSFRNLATGRNAQGKLVALSRKGVIELLDWQSRTIQSEEIPHGADLLVGDGQSVYAGTTLASWNPAMPKIYACAPAVIQLLNVVPGKNAILEQHGSGAPYWRIGKDLGPRNPLLILVSLAGIKLDYFYLPENTWLYVRDGQSVEAGNLLAETVTDRHFNSRFEITGVYQLASILNPKLNRRRAILAECTGQAEVSTIDAQGRCNVLIHEFNGRGLPTKEVIVHPIPPFQRLLVYSRDTVYTGDQLTPGEISPHDLLRICGPKATSSRMLVQVLRTLLLQIWGSVTKIDDRLWEFVLSRLFAMVEVTSPGALGKIPGEWLAGAELRRLNETLRQSVEIADQGDSHFAVRSIELQADFQNACEQIKAAGGKIPQASRPWPIGYRHRLLGMEAASQINCHPLLAIGQSSLRRRLLQAALAGFRDDRNSVQLAILTGQLIPTNRSCW